MSDTSPTGDWLPKQLEIIKSVKKHPILYRNDGTISDPEVLAAAWKIVSKETSLSQHVCQTRWTKIKWNYLKLHQLMKEKKVKQSAIEQNTSTKKYLDGSLDFLSGLLVVEADDEISTQIYKRLEKIFRVQDQSTIEMVNHWLRNIDMSDEAGPSSARPSQPNKNRPSKEGNNGAVGHWQITVTEDNKPNTSTGKARLLSDELMVISSDSDAEDDVF